MRTPKEFQEDILAAIEKRDWVRVHELIRILAKRIEDLDKVIRRDFVVKPRIHE